MADNILVIDDELPIRESIAGILSDEGFNSLCAASAEEGIELLEKESISLILLDIWMPGMDGLKALKIIKQNHEIPVIMISGHGTIETAVQATKDGAFDFIEKPLSYDKVIISIKNGLQLARLSEENQILKENRSGYKKITGNSPAARELKEQIRQVAPTSASVLITGAHGTGKELVAQTIHRLSPRANLPLIEVNCAAIPDELIESELFGHEKGAFTGATEKRKGKFDQANNSTLFLDEIGDMSLKSQAKVLRILQEQTFTRVGGTMKIKVDVRILAATNKNLEDEIEAGNFRADLFYRLNVIPIVVPELKERKEDIPLLVHEFTQELKEKGLGKKTIRPEAMDIFFQHDWPGNVRELKNIIERMFIMINKEVIQADDVKQFLGFKVESNGAETKYNNYYNLGFKEAKKQFEYNYLTAKLKENNGNISQTSQQIGLERSHLHKKLKTLNII